MSIRTFLRVDGKRRITLPAECAQPGDFFEVAYVESEDALVARRVEPQTDVRKILKKFASKESSKSSRKKAKKNK